MGPLFFLGWRFGFGGQRGPLPRGSLWCFILLWLWIVAGDAICGQPTESGGPSPTEAPSEVGRHQRPIVGPSQFTAAVRDKQEYAGHQAPIVALAMSAQGEAAVSASSDGALMLWSPVTKALLRKLKSPDNQLACVAISMDGKLIAAGGSQSLVYVWRGEDGAILHRLQGHKRPIASLSISADNSCAASIDEGGRLIVWDLKAGSGHELVEPEERSKVFRVAHFGPYGKELLTVNRQGDLAAWSMDQMTLLHRVENSGLSAPMAFSFDGVFLAAKGKQGIEVWKRSGRGEWFQRGHTAWPEKPGGEFARLWLIGEDILTATDGKGQFRYWRCGEARDAGGFLQPEMGAGVYTGSVQSLRFLAGQPQGRIAEWELPQMFMNTEEFAANLRQRVREMLQEKKFAEVDEFFARHRADKAWLDTGAPLTFELYQGLYEPRDGNEGDFLALLEEWKRQRPTSITPHVIHSGFFNHKGGTARGTELAYKVPAEAMRKYHECLRKSLEVIEKADELAEKDPELYRLETEAFVGLAMPREELDRAFDQARELDPMYWPAYATKAHYLLRRWHGRPGELAEWLKVSCSQIGPQGDLVYARVACVLIVPCRFGYFEDTELDPAIIRRGLVSLAKNFPHSTLIANPGAIFASWWLDRELARPFFRAIGRDRPDLVYWRYEYLIDHFRHWAESNTPTGQEERFFVPHEFSFSCSAISRDGLLVATGAPGPYPTLSLWDTQNWKRIQTLSVDFVLYSVAFHPTKKLIFLGGAGFDDLPEPEEEDEQERLRPRRGPRRAAVAQLVELTEDGLDVRRSFDGLIGRVKSAAFSPDGAWLAFSTEDEVWVYSLNDEQAKPTFQRRRSDAGGFAFSPDSKTLACSDGYAIDLIDPSTGKSRVSEKILCSSVCCRPYGVAYSHDGKLLAFTDDNERLVVWDLEKEEPRAIMQAKDRNLYSLAFSPDNRFLATGGEKMLVQLWNTQDGKLIHSFQGHWNTVPSVHFLPGAKRLVSFGNDFVARVWNIEKWTQPDSKK